MSANIIIWIAASFFLIALAEPYPNIAIGITSILIVDVLLINSNKYVSLLNGVKV